MGVTMVAVARTRSRDKGYYSADADYNVTTHVVFSRYGLSELCHDTVGNYGSPNPWDLRKITRTGCFMDCDTLLKGKGIPVQMTSSGQLASPSAASLVNRIMSGTGPLTPRLNLPLAIYELKDIPSMLRHAGNLLHKIAKPSGLHNPLKEAGAATLAYQFGWAPLIGDMKKMLNFSSLVASTQRNLRKANSKGGSRRRIGLGSGSAAFYGNEPTWSIYGTGVTQRYSEIKSYDQWATMRWTLRDESQLGKTPTYMEAFNTALGFNRGQIPITVWKALPWSWAIDWFTGISDVLQANYNLIYYKPGPINVMTHSVNLKSYESYRTAKVQVTPGVIRTEWKVRAIQAPNPSISLRLPFLDNFKLSIIGSMAAVRLSR